jgi:hypothetical protein
MRALLLYEQPVDRDESEMGKGKGNRVVAPPSLDIVLTRTRRTLFTHEETGTQTQIRNATLCTGMRRYRVHGMRCLN